MTDVDDRLAAAGRRYRKELDRPFAVDVPAATASDDRSAARDLLLLSAGEPPRRRRPTRWLAGLAAAAVVGGVAAAGTVLVGGHSPSAPAGDTSTAASERPADRTVPVPVPRFRYGPSDWSNCALANVPPFTGDHYGEPKQDWGPFHVIQDGEQDGHRFVVYYQITAQYLSVKTCDWVPGSNRAGLASGWVYKRSSIARPYAFKQPVAGPVGDRQWIFGLVTDRATTVVASDENHQPLGTVPILPTDFGNGVRLFLGRTAISKQFAVRALDSHGTEVGLRVGDMIGAYDQVHDANSATTSPPKSR